MAKTTEVPRKKQMETKEIKLWVIRLLREGIVIVTNYFSLTLAIMSQIFLKYKKDKIIMYQYNEN